MTIGNDFSLDEEEESGKYKVNTREKDVDRNAIPDSVSSFASSQKGVELWDHDPETQKDYADEPIVRVYIDVIAKAISSEDCHIMNMETEEVDSEKKKELDELHPESTFREVREMIGAEIESTGNVFIVMNRMENSDEIGEIIIPRSETMFVVTDENGIVSGYVQKLKGQKANLIDKENVIHLKWGSRAGKPYAESPVWQAKETIETISELYEKEILDLREGEQSGVIAVKQTRMNSKEIQAFGNDINTNKGERHEVSVVDGDVEYVDFNSNYSDMEILDRYRFHIQALSSAFRVSPSFVGFNMRSGGMGQGRAREEERKNQDEAVNIIVSKIQDQLNRHLIRPMFGEEYKLVFDSVDEDSEREVDYYEQLGNAIQSLLGAGIDLELEDDAILIPDGQELTGGQVKELAKNRPVMEMLTNEYDKDEVQKMLDTSESGVREDVDLSDRKSEFVEKTSSESFEQAMKKVEDVTSTRTEAIEHTQELLSGNMSNSTYYNWIDEVGLD